MSSNATFVPRRRPRLSQSDLEEVPPEKLSQEAFRLLRTVQSLLNTREPDLAHRLSGSGCGSGCGSGSGSGCGSGDSEPRSDRSSVVSLDQHDEPPASPTLKDSGSALVSEVTGALRRKLNIRNSQVRKLPDDIDTLCKHCVEISSHRLVIEVQQPGG